MNNPFLSDRNIFSKVKSPISTSILKPTQKDKTSVNPNSEFGQNNKYNQNKIDYEKDFKPKYNNSSSNSALNTNSQPYKKQYEFIKSDKMTFGDPSTAALSSKTKNDYGSNKNINSISNEIDKNLLRKSSKQQKFQYKPKYQPSYQNQQSYQYKPSINDYQSPPKEQKQLSYKNKYQAYEYKPYQQEEDLEYRFKSNANGKQLSPIGQVSRHKINDDSFMNLDAIINDTDLSKLLADSRNQQDLIKMLNLNVDKDKGKNKYQEYDADFKGKKNNYPDYSDKPKYSGNNYNSYEYKSDQYEFKKDIPKRQYRQLQQPQVYKYSEEQENQRVTIPTFKSIKPKQYQNYHTTKSPYSNIMGSGQQYPIYQNYPESQTISEIKKVNDKNPPQLNSYSGSVKNQNFNTDNLNLQGGIQQIIAREMKKMSMKMSEQQKLNGNNKNSGNQNNNYRVFLTSNQKITTVKYNLKLL